MCTSFPSPVPLRPPLFQLCQVANVVLQTAQLVLRLESESAVTFKWLQEHRIPVFINHKQSIGMKLTCE